MAYQAIGIGSSANDGTGDTLRIGADKVNDNFVEVYQYNSSDPFWQELGWPGQSYGSAGCGYTIGSYPGITPLSGWDSGSVSVGYRDSGAGRVWLADFDWQDGNLSTRTQQVLGYMLSNRN